MFFIFSKLIAFLTTPFFWVVLLMLYGWWKKKRKALVAAGITLLVFSNSFILDEVSRQWEPPAVHLDTLARDYDVGIVLSGMVSYDQTLERIGFHESIDRMLQAVDLYKQGFIRKILISGGSGSILEDDREALLLQEYFTRIGLPKEDILIEPESRNTHENAVNSSMLLKEHLPHGKYLLITSGYHMRRALACFRKEGIDADPFVTHRSSGPRKFIPDHLLLPSASTLAGWERLTHEWVGYLVYAVTGYV
ncbi:MAG: YdcF family protein [Flavobacteriales bacterium]|nr:YdcF family protein [Flavobacteriales bacterium]MCB9447483.1 YdcF family protein [Flavobacteriales bacterium]